MKSKKIFFLWAFICSFSLYQSVNPTVRIDGIEIPLDTVDAVQLLQYWSINPNLYAQQIGELLAKVPEVNRSTITDLLTNVYGKSLSKGASLLVGRVISALSGASVTSQAAQKIVEETASAVTDKLSNSVREIAEAAAQEALQKAGTVVNEEAVQAAVESAVQVAVDQASPAVSEIASQIGESVASGAGEGVSPTLIGILEKPVEKVMEEAANSAAEKALNVVLPEGGEKVSQAIEGVTKSLEDMVKNTREAVSEIVENATKEITENVSTQGLPPVSPSAITQKGWMGGIKDTFSGWGSTAKGWWGDSQSWLNNMSVDQLTANMPATQELARIIKENPKTAAALALGTAALWGGLSWKLMNSRKAARVKAASKPKVGLPEVEQVSTIPVGEKPIIETPQEMPAVPVAVSLEQEQDVLARVGLTEDDIIEFSKNILAGLKKGESGKEPQRGEIEISRILEKGDFWMKVVSYYHPYRQESRIDSVQVKTAEMTGPRKFDITIDNTFLTAQYKELSKFLIRRIEKVGSEGIRVPSVKAKSLTSY